MAATANTIWQEPPDTMLKGSRDAVVREMRSVSIHGQMSWEIVFTFLDDPGEQLNAARVGPEAISGGTVEVGDRIQVEYLVGVVVKVTRLPLYGDQSKDGGRANRGRD
jgi:hypothetical protein